MNWHVFLLGASFLVAVSVPEFADAQQKVVASLDWSQVQLPDSTVLRHDGDEGPVLEVNVNHRSIIALWSLDEPQVENQAHAISGRIRVLSASDIALLEMWTCFGDDGDWYSRVPIALDPSGQDSGWLDFEVPFDIGGDYTLSFPPNKMLLTLELPDGGLLWLSNLNLIQYRK